MHRKASSDSENWLRLFRIMPWHASISRYAKTDRMRIRTIVLGALVVVVSFVGATLVMNALWPTSLQRSRPQLVAVPPLLPLTRTSTVLVPVAITMSAISDVLEKRAPRNLT